MQCATEVRGHYCCVVRKVYCMLRHASFLFSITSTAVHAIGDRDGDRVYSLYRRFEVRDVRVVVIISPTQRLSCEGWTSFLKVSNEPRNCLIYARIFFSSETANGPKRNIAPTILVYLTDLALPEVNSRVLRAVCSSRGN